MLGSPLSAGTISKPAGCGLLPATPAVAAPLRAGCVAPAEGKPRDVAVAEGTFPRAGCVPAAEGTLREAVAAAGTPLRADTEARPEVPWKGTAVEPLPPVACLGKTSAACVSSRLTVPSFARRQ